MKNRSAGAQPSCSTL